MEDPQDRAAQRQHGYEHGGESGRRGDRGATVQRLRGGVGQLDQHQLPRLRLAPEQARLVAARATAQHLGVGAAGPRDEHLLQGADQRRVLRRGVAGAINSHVCAQPVGQTGNGAGRIRYNLAVSAALEHLLDDLNPPQRDAVLAGDGPLLVLAGAGSGKTRVIAHRIAHLIGVRGVDPRNVLAVPFTNKAAGEMARRVEALLAPVGIRPPLIATFHSACVRILRRHGEHIGLPPHPAELVHVDRLGIDFQQVAAPAAAHQLHAVTDGLPQ